MKIKYAPEALNMCSHIKIYDFDNIEARQLKELFEELAAGESEWASLKDLDNLEAEDGCAMTMRVGAWDKGVRNLGQNKKFEWILTEESWKHIAQVSEVFCEEDCYEHQEWFEQKKGDIPVLLESQPYEE